MKMAPLLLSGLSLSAILFSAVKPVPERLVWNRTGSAPQGLYWLSDEPFTKGSWVVVSARSAEAEWASAHGFIGRDWPLLKRVAGLPGDEICRSDTTILINRERVGQARLRDSSGRHLPSWEGCVVLGQDQIFLMNAHPGSLDGRYCGPVEISDLDGIGRLILKWR